MKYIKLLTAAIFSLFISESPAQPKIVAHRGYWKTEGSAQNSIRSLKEAHNAGCYGSEVDVWLTADGKLVVFHDHIIKDANGKGFVIEETAYDDIKNITLANGEYVPTLQQYLKTAKKLKNIILVIELKSQHNTPPQHETELTKKVIEAVRKANMQARVEYIAFSRHVTEEVIRLDGKAKISYLNGDLTPVQLKEIGCTGLDYNLSVLRANPDWIKEAHDLGLTVNVWTVNIPADMQYFIYAEADYITTDEPIAAQKAVNEKYGL